MEAVAKTKACGVRIVEGVRESENERSVRVRDVNERSGAVELVRDNELSLEDGAQGGS